MSKTLFDILSYKKDDENDPFNKYRDILEEVMDLLAREGMFGGNTQKTALNDRIDKFATVYKGKIPQYVVPSLKLLLVSSALSHADTMEKSEVEEGRAPFMYDTLLMAMKTVLVWLRPFIDSVRKTALDVVKEGVEQKDAEPPVDHTKLEQNLLGTEVGTLLVKYWNVRIGDKYALNPRTMAERSWHQGMKLRVRLSKNYKGEDEVAEVVRVEQ